MQFLNLPNNKNANVKDFSERLMLYHLTSNIVTYKGNV